LVEETGEPGENNRPAIGHWQTWSHNVVSSTPRNERDSNSEREVVIDTNCIGIQTILHMLIGEYFFPLTGYI
jgi:hypothetical protein